ncbi:exodeoxyribonuclease VII large subunit [Rhodoluna lacicola]|uniref:Exodeoxyribonuclease 7 large subunit n=1 Tax=Rhodoluna lacicola TaxID=529884 RepID=A0A060JD35_9MICO|nr:exodeoxyribonuclease VII large subunit [Rhodoluna lacicola]AIC47786.1 exodeoxyribonuclease VII, large subunit [Rhodoluna lacicola]
MSEEELAGASKVSSELSPWPVSRLSLTLKEWIERLGVLWIEGELASIKIGASNMFGELRDLQIENSVSIHSWNVSKIPNDLKQGDRVLALIKPAFWPKGGKLTMQVIEMRKVGLGELLERIERLRAQLTKEGLTSVDRKQPLPFLPNKIGLITGKDSDAEKDVLQNAKLRWPDVQFRIMHTLVQGDKAAPEIINAIKTLDEDPEVDVIIIARGGGSFLDLMVFSDEALVRAAASAKTPIVSAIGHENDRPVLDDVADLRASTPTDAAKRVVPDVAEEKHKLEQLRQRLFMRVDTFVANQLGMIEQIRSRPILANPYTFIEAHEADVERAVDQMRSRLDQTLSREAMQIGHLRQQVRSLSPQSTLDRGYSVVRDLNGHVISDPNQIKKGQRLKLRLAKGELGAVAE